MSVVDMRYRQTIQGLAIVANNPGVMPSVALNSGGTATVSNTVGLESSTTWDQAVLGFSKQLLNLSGKHVPQQQWTVAPVVPQPNLEAIYAAFLWVIYGPPPEGTIGMERLRGFVHGDTTSYHFDVARYLSILPPNWLGRGRDCDVPRDACYRAHCGDTYVWVSPGGMPAFSEFVLVILDIATTDPTSLVYAQPKAAVDIVAYGTKYQSSSKPLYTITEARGVAQMPDKSIHVGISSAFKAPPSLAPDANVQLSVPQRVDTFY